MIRPMMISKTMAAAIIGPVKFGRHCISTVEGPVISWLPLEFTGLIVPPRKAQRGLSMGTACSDRFQVAVLPAFSQEVSLIGG